MREKIDHVNHQGSAAADDVLEAIHAVMHRVRTRQHQVMRDGEQDLTPLEARVLAFFAHHPGATQVELARHSGRDKGQLARLLTGLKARGLLQAEPDASDRRVTRLHLSDAARQQHQAVVALRKQLAQAAVTGFSADERSLLLTLLERLRHNLDAAT